MDIRNTFKVAQEISSLYDKYSNEDIGNNEQAEIHYNRFTEELAMLHSKLLQIGQFAREDILDNQASTIVKYDTLPSHASVTVYYVYENEQLALVEDTAMELYLIPLDNLKFKD